LPVKICFLGLDNLAVLAPQYGRHPAGGEAVQQTLLARALARRGHEVSMVVADLGQPDGAQWERMRTWKAAASWRGLWAALARADAELYYASGAGAQAGLLALFCARHRRRLVLRAPAGAQRPSRLQRFGLRRAHAVLVPGAAGQRALAGERLPSRVAGTLVDGDAPAAAAARDIDVLWTSPMRGPARPDRALSLARRLPRARVHMAGGPLAGDEALFRVMRHMAGDIPNLSFLGPLEYREAIALHGRAKLLLGTGDDEGLPQSYLQAWARGAPVAALADPGGVIAREGLGVVAAAPCALVDAARALLEDEAAWRAASARCTRFMAREYGEARVLRDYLAAFEDALGGGARGAGRGGAPLHA